MAYEDVEALWLARVRNNTTYFDSDNSSRGDWLALNSGADRHYAILKPGEHEHASLGLGGRSNNTWRTVIQIWTSFVDDSETLTTHEDVVNTTRAELQKYRLAGDTTGNVRDAMIVQTRETVEMWRESGGVEWLRTDLIAQAEEEEVIAFTE